MDKVSITIIGAGIVGLAVARELSEEFQDIVVLEKWDSFGRETSSRNSEVVHAGIYYDKDALKTLFCVEGNALLYELCRKNHIPCRRTEKIIIATCDKEIEDVERLFQNGKNNGVKGLKLITKKDISRIEPNITGESGILSETTGIIDTHQVMKYFEMSASEKGVTFSYNCEVTDMQFEQNSYRITVKDSDGELFNFLTDVVINSAGLRAQEMSGMLGVDIRQENSDVRYYKGEYFSISNRHRGKVKRLIYPVPNPLSLGLHTVVRLDGTLKLGPNAFPVEDIDYDVDESHKEEFLHESKKYMPFIEDDDLSPDMSGIRPKLFHGEEVARDFMICHEKKKGCPNFINLIGIESPGFTAAPAIARYVRKIVKDEFL